MAELPARLVLFDGVCGFCDLAVSWLLRHDRDQRLMYAPLQGETAAELRTLHPEVPANLDTMVFVDEGRVYLRSRAFARLARYLPAPWSWLRVYAVLPAAFTDVAYNLFASIRYRIFGKRETCRIPTAGERSRFLP